MVSMQWLPQVGQIVGSGQTKDYKMDICCFSAWLKIRIMCPSEATYLPHALLFHELALKIQLSMLV